MALERNTASQLDQFLRDVSHDLDLVGPRRLQSVVEGRLEPFGDQVLSHLFDRRQARANGGDNILIATPVVLVSIGERQDAAMEELPRHRLADGHQVFKCRNRISLKPSITTDPGTVKKRWRNDSINPFEGLPRILGISSRKPTGGGRREPHSPDRFARAAGRSGAAS